jgi:hypothetical protein
MKYILDGWKDGQTDRGKTVYPPPPSGSGGISVFGPVRFLLPVGRLSWSLYTLNIYAHFSSHFSQQLLMTENICRLSENIKFTCTSSLETDTKVRFWPVRISWLSCNVKKSKKNLIFPTVYCFISLFLAPPTHWA